MSYRETHHFEHIFAWWAWKEARALETLQRRPEPAPRRRNRNTRDHTC